MDRAWPRLAVLLLLGACAPEPPEDAPLPLPPPTPPHVLTGRLPPMPPRQRPEPEPEPAPEAAAQAPNGAPEATTPAATPAAAAPQPVWRVQRDGTVGCAERAALRLLRQRADVAPRAIAEARAAGGCRTTFRVNEWTVVGGDAELVQLRLMNGSALTLWFPRVEVAPPP